MYISCYKDTDRYIKVLNIIVLHVSKLSLKKLGIMQTQPMQRYTERKMKYV